MFLSVRFANFRTCIFSVQIGGTMMNGSQHKDLSEFILAPLDYAQKFQKSYYFEIIFNKHCC